MAVWTGLNKELLAPKQASKVPRYGIFFAYFLFLEMSYSLYKLGNETSAMKKYILLSFFLPILAPVYADEIPDAKVTGPIDMSNEEYEKYSQYCMDHANDILSGVDPLDTLRKAGMSYLPEHITCQNLDMMTLQSRNMDDILHGDSPLADLFK